MKLKKKGFTILEVMIAIAVFSVGILSVLQLIIKNMVVVDTAKQKTFATFLAKEWIELTYNLRDSNLKKYLPRDCIMNPIFYELTTEQVSNNQDTICEFFASWVTDWKYLQLSFDSSGYFYSQRQEPWQDFFEDFKNNKLYYNQKTINDIPLVRYSNKKPENQLTREEYFVDSFFARYIVFKPVVEQWEELPLNKILKVESHVLILKWGYTGEIVLESFIWNY